MKKIIRRSALVTAAFTLALLQACGGGGGGGSDSGSGAATASAEGLWEGIASSRGNALDISLVVLENGRYYGVYSQNGDAYGLLEGNGSVAGGTFSSSNGRDYPFGDLVYTPFTLTAALTPKVSIGGTAQYSSFQATFNATYDTSYDTAVNLASLAGTYTGSAGTLQGVEDVTLVVASSGSFIGTSSTGCVLSGTMVPRSAGKAVLDLTVTFDAATCGESLTVTGIAGQSETNGLVFAATLADRSDAFYGVAFKP
jgi:hypothetical protein